jgi:hypothetical protein
MIYIESILSKIILFLEIKLMDLIPQEGQFTYLMQIQILLIITLYKIRQFIMEEP